MDGGNNSYLSPNFVGNNSAAFINGSRYLSLESHLKSSSGLRWINKYFKQSFQLCGPADEQVNKFDVKIFLRMALEIKDTILPELKNITM